MSLSLQISGLHVTLSPCGNLIACVSNNEIKIHYSHFLEQSTTIPCRIQSKDVSSLKWSPKSERIAIVAADAVEIIDLDDTQHRIRLNNGSGGFGRFSSVDFIGENCLLTIWEFGKTKTWSLTNGKIFELGDVKTTSESSSWQLRPGSDQDELSPTIALLSRLGVDDLLTIVFPATQKSLTSKKLKTADAQSISWSPSGSWIAVLDSPLSSIGATFHTPDGHFFRSYSPVSADTATGLGARFLTWSADSRHVALVTFDSQIVVINTRTFGTGPVIEHATTIHDHSTSPDGQAPIWQEVVSASNHRSYVSCSYPFSPPLHKMKTGTESHELGIVECCFNSDGTFLASRHERTPGTIWIWNVARLSPIAFIIQHNPVRKTHWHPSQPWLVMLDCGEGIAYLYDAARLESPEPIIIAHPVPAHLSWAPTTTGRKSAILAATKGSFRLCYPEGLETDQAACSNRDVEQVDGDASEDSIFDVLSGRKPIPPKTEPSYTEMVDLEVDALDACGNSLMEDTFRDKQIPTAQRHQDADPFDDSEIF